MSSTNIIKTTIHPSMENAPDVENIRLIYLDNSPPNLSIQSNLLELNPGAQFYTDVQLCIDFLQSNSTEQIFLIISNIFSLDLLNLLYSFSSILAIFIYDHNKQEINDFKSQYPKIIDQYTNEYDLFQSIQSKLQLNEKQIFIYYLFNENTRDLTKESASFLWHYMLINILKQIPSNQSIDKEMLNKCSDYYRINSYELFHQNYSSQQAIQWYKSECFLYKLLNRAFRTENIEILYSFQYFLIDLCLEIKREYENLKNQEKYLIVYRAQIMSKKEIEKLQKNIGCFILTNGFLSTSRDKNISLAFFQQNFSINENVLFEIHVDLSRIILADISSFSSMSSEKEILFYMNSIFKIDSVEYDLINHLWNIKINTDETKCIDEYLQSIQKEMDYQSSMIFWGHLLWNKLGQINQAKIFFHILLNSLSNYHKDIPRIYMELGDMNDEMGEYNLALNNYQYALEIYQKQIPKNYIRIALLLNKNGIVYKHMKNIDRAIDYYRQALNIYETKCLKGENHLHRANIMENLGLAYRDKNDLDTALTYFTLAYNIRCDILSNDHPLLVNSLVNTGNIYHDKNDLIQALNYYQQALSIQEIIYPDDHLNKSNTIRGIGLIYRDKQDWINALNYFNRTFEMRQRLLPNQNHPDIAICYGDIGNIYEKMNNLDLALDSYHQQFQMEEKCLPFNHPNLILHFDWIINILKKKDQTNKAVELCQEKLSNLKTLLKNEYENHPRTARIFVLLATIYEDKNPKQADQHYQQALTIFEHNKIEDIFPTCLSTMTNFYWKCRMFDRALICQMKLLNLRRSTLLSNDNDIAYSLRGLARLYRAMNKSTEALQYFEQSLTILQINLGSEHTDVKNIEQEIFDLKDIIKSISSSANEDYNYRRTSSINKQSLPPSPNNSTSTPTYETKIKPSMSVSKSAACLIL